MNKYIIIICRFFYFYLIVFMSVWNICRPEHLFNQTRNVDFVKEYISVYILIPKEMFFNWKRQDKIL